MAKTIFKKTFKKTLQKERLHFFFSKLNIVEAESSFLCFLFDCLQNNGSVALLSHFAKCKNRKCKNQKCQFQILQEIAFGTSITNTKKNLCKIFLALHFKVKCLSKATLPLMS